MGSKGIQKNAMKAIPEKESLTVEKIAQEDGLMMVTSVLRLEALLIWCPSHGCQATWR